MRFANARNLVVLLTSVALLAIALNGCGKKTRGYPHPVDGPGEHRDVSRVPDATPKIEPRSRGGNPSTYVVLGKRYYTLPDGKGFVERGIASWYGRKFHGRKTSNGEVYDMYTMTAAHKRLPIPTYLKVTNLENGRSVVVRVNDRGPFHENRVVDLSYAAASRIGMLGKGTALVEIRSIDPAAPRRPQTTQVVYSPLPTKPGKPVSGQPQIFLQAGAFTSSENAERLRKRLQRGLSLNVRITPVHTASGAVHRVQVGPLASVAVADNVSTQMHELGIQKPLVVID